ncbi:MAG TPA: polysaccharide deacetylase family protein [Acidobacteriaceae bacterium]
MGRLGATAAATAVIGLLGGALAYASLWPTSQWFGETLIAGDDPDERALTFDDGPNDAATPHLLDVLAKHRVRATFFVMGAFARQRPEIVRRAAAEGHLIGNHTMSHPKLAFESQRKIRQELTDCSAVLEDLTGQPVRIFRPPFGSRRPVVLQVARDLGLTPVMWNVTCHDWDPIGTDAIVTHMGTGIAANNARRRGSNILLHDGGHRGMGAHRMDTINAVDQLLSRAQTGTAKRWVTVDAWTAES